ncbi:hypothetical protein SD70_00115 [Gordoniibacillus kamchatkensis]|uniref:DUF218 domain-containing protein n=1 Tax=Gordoniibacillus kamchatkensis TaxID=1590651 RepID=A0ABR5ANF1_9BACL|nr:hypothetical protein SD70_00115 [Paenibacillus sp. VKM B-2647]
MLMLIKAMYSLVLPPACFALLFAAAAVWLFVRSRRVKTALAVAAATVLFWLSGTPLVGSTLMRSLEQRYAPPTGTTGADCIVLLTGGATLGTPNIGGELGHVSSSTAGRLVTAARLARDTGLPLIVSGGQVFAASANEAEAVRRELLGLGIPDRQIRLERTSRNTEENAANTARLMRANGFTRPLLVTSAWHMPRALALFSREGVAAVPVPTDYAADGSLSPTPLLFMMTPSGMEMTGTALKEYLGLLVIQLRR